jgi:phosphoserine phosphatase
MTTSLSPAAQQFIQSVLDQKPRLAVFDCDGTLWKADSGERFFRWEMERHLVSPAVAAKLTARYKLYESGDVSEDDMCGEMVTMHEGIPVMEIERAIEDFYPEVVAPGIFPEMQALTLKLKDIGCEMWAISSTNDWVVRRGVRDFGFAPERVIAACVHCHDGHATGNLIRVPSGEGKAVAVREIIKRTPDMAFGNSRWDQAMLELVSTPYAINPNPDLATIARARGWTIYQPQ